MVKGLPSVEYKGFVPKARVKCGHKQGLFIGGRPHPMVICECSECQNKPLVLPGRVFTASQFEIHGGKGSAKKWRHSLLVVGVPHAKKTRIGSYLNAESQRIEDLMAKGTIKRTMKIRQADGGLELVKVIGSEEKPLERGSDIQLRHRIKYITAKNKPEEWVILSTERYFIVYETPKKDAPAPPKTINDEQGNIVLKNSPLARNRAPLEDDDELHHDHSTPPPADKSPKQMRQKVNEVAAPDTVAQKKEKRKQVKRKFVISSDDDEDDVEEEGRKNIPPSKKPALLSETELEEDMEPTPEGLVQEFTAAGRMVVVETEISPNLNEVDKMDDTHDQDEEQEGDLGNEQEDYGVDCDAQAAGIVQQHQDDTQLGIYDNNTNPAAAAADNNNEEEEEALEDNQRPEIVNNIYATMQTLFEHTEGVEKALGEAKQREDSFKERAVKAEEEAAKLKALLQESKSEKDALLQLFSKMRGWLDVVLKSAEVCEEAAADL